MATTGPITTDAHMKLYAGHLDTLNEKNKSIIDLALIIDAFVRDFPEGSNALIHCQGNDIFKAFQNKLLKFLDIYLSSNDGFFHRFDSDNKKGQCVEAALLQNLAKLPISLNSSSDLTPSHVFYKKSLKKHIQELINRITSYLEKSQHTQINTITFTLSALSYFDVSKLKLTGLVDECKRKIFNSLKHCTPEGSIRVIHSMILLSHENDKFKTYLNDEQVKELLSIVINMPLDKNDAQHQSLANQLYQIRNIYPSVFPQELSKRIEPFLTGFQEQAHGSGFEAKAAAAVRRAMSDLGKTYPGLIEREHFNAKNPINAALGLESDFTYEHGDLRVCMQVDGDKYHLYPGTKTKTQRTKLRDFAFQDQEWKMVVFSGSLPQDSPKTAAEQLTLDARNQLLANVVIPTFDIKTCENMDLLKKAKDSLSKESTVSLEACQSELTALLGELETTIASSATMPLLSIRYSELNASLEALQAKKQSLNDQLRSYEKNLSDNKTQLESEERKCKKECEPLGNSFTASLAAEPYKKKIATLNSNRDQLQKTRDAISKTIAACEQEDICLQQALQAVLTEIAGPIPGSELVSKCQDMIQRIQRLQSTPAAAAVTPPQQAGCAPSKSLAHHAQAPAFSPTPQMGNYQYPTQPMSAYPYPTPQMGGGYYSQPMGAYPYPTPQMGNYQYPTQQMDIFYPPQTVYFPPGIQTCEEESYEEEPYEEEPYEEEPYEDETYQEVYEEEHGGATYYWENVQPILVTQYRQAQAIPQNLPENDRQPFALATYKQSTKPGY